MAETGVHTPYTVVAARAESACGVTLRLDALLPAAPGQFVMAWLPGIEERPLCLMDDGPASLTIADVGPFTHACCALAPGDRIWLRGPYGHGFPLVGERPLLLAGGCGAAALALLAQRFRARGTPITAVVGARSADGLMLAWRYQELGCRVVLATDDGSAGYHGTSLDAATPHWPAADAIYACGPEPMLRAVARQARETDKPAWISLERVMKCGIGVCGSCHCGDRLVCADGPVFPSATYLAAIE